MNNRLLILLFFALSCVCAHAETVVLRTGARVKGTIVFQNEEVVIVRDAETGARFQYPRADVETIEADKAEEEIAETEPQTQDLTVSKKVSIALEIAGGAAVNPGYGAGAAVSADLLVGSHHIGDRHLFIGGGLGYHGLFIGGEKYNFLPLQVALRMPFMESKHAPVFGVALGYGIALAKNYAGGLYAGLDLGYRCQLNPKTAIAVVAYAQFQQTKVRTVEAIEELTFTQYSGRNLVCPGVKIALYF